MTTTLAGMMQSGAFLPSARFQGARSGYIFKAGPEGVGYYRDAQPQQGGRRGGSDGRRQGLQMLGLGKRQGGCLPRTGRVLDEEMH